MKRPFFLTLAALLSATPAFAALPPGVTFFNDWSHGPAHNTPGAWNSRDAISSGRISLVNDPASPLGGKVARIEVDPGDKVSGWTGERAEVSGMQDAGGQPFAVDEGSGHEYYAISVKLSPDWQAPQPDPDNHSTWGIFFQLHGANGIPAGTPPAIALAAENDFHINLDTGDVLEGGRRKHPQGLTSLPFSNGALDKGHWVEFLLDIVWAADHSGSITVYRRDEGQTKWQDVFHLHNAATLEYAHGQPVLPHFWKAGYYRSGSPFTSVLYLGPIARGTDRDAVAMAAFGKK